MSRSLRRPASALLCAVLILATAPCGAMPRVTAVAGSWVSISAGTKDGVALGATGVIYRWEGTTRRNVASLEIMELVGDAACRAQIEVFPGHSVEPGDHATIDGVVADVVLVPVEIVVRLPEADIQIDGKSLGGPVVRADVTVGRHVVRVVAAGSVFEDEIIAEAGVKERHVYGAEHFQGASQPQPVPQSALTSPLPPASPARSPLPTVDGIADLARRGDTAGALAAAEEAAAAPSPSELLLSWRAALRVDAGSGREEAVSWLRATSFRDPAVAESAARMIAALDEGARPRGPFTCWACGFELASGAIDCPHCLAFQPHLRRCGTADGSVVSEFAWDERGLREVVTRSGESPLGGAQGRERPGRAVRVQETRIAREGDGTGPFELVVTERTLVSGHPDEAVEVRRAAMTTASPRRLVDVLLATGLEESIVLPDSLIPYMPWQGIRAFVPRRDADGVLRSIEDRETGDRYDVRFDHGRLVSLEAASGALSRRPAYDDKGRLKHELLTMTIDGVREPRRVAVSYGGHGLDRIELDLPMGNVQSSFQPAD